MNILIAVITGLIALVLGIPGGYSLYSKAKANRYTARRIQTETVYNNLETVTVNNHPFHLIRTEEQFRQIVAYLPGCIGLCCFAISESMPRERFIQLIEELLRNKRNSYIRDLYVSHLYEEGDQND